MLRGGLADRFVDAAKQLDGVEFQRPNDVEIFGNIQPALAAFVLGDEGLRLLQSPSEFDGTLSKSALKQLRGCGDGEAEAGAAPSVRPGARLVRSWGGATHEVTVIERGFAYRGTTYRSLSEIAQQITGAHWSGPRFFGIRSAEKKTRRTA